MLNFSNASSFNQPLNSWDVSNVSVMYEMFDGATFFNQPLTNWDVSSVTDLKNIFAISFNQPVDTWHENWNLSNI